jgi:hypothetical protein
MDFFHTCWAAPAAGGIIKKNSVAFHGMAAIVDLLRSLPLNTGRTANCFISVFP